MGRSPRWAGPPDGPVPDGLNPVVGISIALVIGMFIPPIAWALLVAAGLFMLLSQGLASWAGNDLRSVLNSPVMYFPISSCYVASFSRGLLSHRFAV